MKNVIFTHNELQMSLFLSFVEGLRYHKIPKGYFIAYDTEGEYFAFMLFRSATKPENGDAKELIRHKISKGDYQMNDVRPTIVIKYLSEMAHHFTNEVNSFLSKNEDK
jgi:hypothetical protein